MAQLHNSTEQAMNQVLEAERTAHAAVRECEQQAAELIDAVQQQVRRIHSRTDTRLSQVHARCALALGQQVETLLRQEADSGGDAVLGDEMHELLAAAIARLAASLTDGSCGDD